MDTVERLKQLVREHRICWEVLPEEFPVAGERPLQVGFDLQLYGAHGHDADHPAPGCEHCKVVFRHLREIAEWIMPKEERLSLYEVDVFDSAIRYDPARGRRPEVMLNILIRHRSQFDMPVDECEVLCLNEMKAKLLQIGARHQHWRDS